MKIQDFQDFLNWEKTSRDTIDFKKIDVDIAGGLVAGLLLSQIIYWYLPDKHGNKKLRVRKKDKESGEKLFWIAKARYEWWDEIRLTPKQIDRAIKLLCKNEIIKVQRFKFNGAPTQHIRLLENNFMKLLETRLNTPVQNPNKPVGKMHFNQREKTDITPMGNSLTENTHKINSKNNIRLPTTGKHLFIFPEDIYCDRCNGLFTEPLDVIDFDDLEELKNLSICECEGVFTVLYNLLNRLKTAKSKGLKYLYYENSENKYIDLYETFI